MKKIRKIAIPTFILPMTLLALVGGLFNNDSQIIEVSASQHKDNFSNYTYSGEYYSKISSELTDGENGTLRSTLTSLVRPVSTPTYSGSGSNTLSSILQEADEDPTNSNNMIYFYTRDSVSKNAAQSWNREHTWPQSLSNNNWGKTRAGSDLLHIRPTYNSTNSNRGNNKYGNVNGDALTYNSMVYGYKSGSLFMPIEANKGDAARIVMYVWTAYHDEYSSKPLSITSIFESYETMLKWHIADKPDLLEGHRNDVALNSMQKNRNPFVDHPEYACHIFGDKVSTQTKNLCYQTYGESLPINPIDTDTPTNTDTDTPVTNNKLPTWAIVTIIVAGATLSLGLVTAITIFLIKRKRKIM